MPSQNTSNPIPHGYCHCGCGQRAPIAKKTDGSSERVKGQPQRFIYGHYKPIKRTEAPPPNPSGLCICGCGMTTPLATRTQGFLNRVKGEHVLLYPGHRVGRSVDLYVEMDRGYVTPCWVWQRGLTSDGYGSMAAGLAHRVFYEEHGGEIPEGMQLDHLCRQRDCVNPDHLEPVTNQQNVQRGKLAKLSSADVLEIRRLRGVYSNRKLATMFGVSPFTVGRIQSGASWNNLAGAEEEVA